VMLGPPSQSASAPEELRGLLVEPQLRSADWNFALHVAFPSEASLPVPGTPKSAEFLTEDLSIFAPGDSAAAARFAAALASLGLAERAEADTILTGLLLAKFASFPLHGSWEGGRCVFGLMSKLNHACFPNCVCLWPGLPPGEEVALDPMREMVAPGTTPLRCARLRALCRIQPGDELTFCYFGGDFAVQVRSTEERRRRLWEGFEFECRCELCEPGDQPAKSYGQLCKRALCFGKPPPLPPEGLRRGPRDLSAAGADRKICSFLSLWFSTLPFAVQPPLPRSASPSTST
ncbi:Smyd1, partial [Symbiodinium sp. CCMP2456]